MPNTKPIYLPFDSTAQSLLNLIENESHSLVAVPLKLIKPNYSPFYKKDLVVTHTGLDGVTQPLAYGTDYTCLEFLADHTKATGHATYRTLLITRQNIAGSVNITYRSIGGQQNGSVQQTLEEVARAIGTVAQVPWSEVHDKPVGYNPKPHFQDAGDLYGMEYLQRALVHVKECLANTTNNRKQAFNEAVNQLVLEWAELRKITPDAMLAHFKDVVNGHATTKEQIGLADVQNVTLCTPLLLAQLMSSDARNASFAHFNNYTNPHEVTKTQLGLENVNDYPLAVVTENQSTYSVEEYVSTASLLALAEKLLSDYHKKVSLGSAKGVVKLNAASKIASTQIPPVLGYVCDDTYDYFSGKPSAGQIIFSSTTLRNPHSLLILKRSKVRCDVAPSTDIALTLSKNGIQIGRFVIVAGETKSTYVSTSGSYIEKVLPGDLIQIKAPINVDTTLSGISIGLMAGVSI